MNPDCDVAVVGGGPAGLAAAALAAELGLSVTLFDDQPRPGGQIYRAVESVAARRPDHWSLLGADYQAGLSLVEAFRGTDAVYRPGVVVWEVTDEGTLGIIEDGAARIVSARRIIVAPGAMERPVPIPGWTLPGVMGAGAAQTLLKASGLVPDVPTVLAGSGPLIFLVATQLVRLGAPPKAVLLTAPAANRRAAVPHVMGALKSFGDLWKGMVWQAGARRAGVRFVSGVEDVRALADEAGDRLEAVSYRQGGREHRLEAGLLLLHEGVVPNTQLSMAAGCDHAWDGRSLCWRPERDEWGTTSLPAIAVAGDAAGIEAAKAAVPLGRLAALDTAHRLGALSRDGRDRRAEPYRKALAAARAIRPFLDALFRPAPAMLVPQDDEVMVCRCEEVTAGQIREAVSLGAVGPNQLKSYTRCGMGPCSGADVRTDRLSHHRRGPLCSDPGGRPPAGPRTRASDYGGRDGGPWRHRHPARGAGRPARRRAERCRG